MYIILMKHWPTNLRSPTFTFGTLIQFRVFLQRRYLNFWKDLITDLTLIVLFYMQEIAKCQTSSQLNSSHCSVYMDADTDLCVRKDVSLVNRWWKTCKSTHEQFWACSLSTFKQASFLLWFCPKALHRGSLLQYARHRNVKKAKLRFCFSETTVTTCCDGLSWSFLASFPLEKEVFSVCLLVSESVEAALGEFWVVVFFP